MGESEMRKKKEKERAEGVKNCEDFGTVLRMKMRNWWMGLRRYIDDRLLEQIKKIEEGPEEELKKH